MTALASQNPTNETNKNNSSANFTNAPWGWVALGFIVRTYTMIWLLMRSVQSLASSRNDFMFKITGVVFFILGAFLLHNLFAQKVSKGKYAKWALFTIVYGVIFVIIMVAGPDDGIRTTDSISSSISTLKFIFTLY